MTKKEIEEICAKYRISLRSPVGRDVLTDILKSTHFLQTLSPDNPAQIGEYNMGIAILAKYAGSIIPEDLIKAFVKVITTIEPKGGKT